jgi:hypothetical protein
MKNKYRVEVANGNPFVVAVYDVASGERVRLADGAAREGMEILPFCVALVDCFSTVELQWLVPDYTERLAEVDALIKRVAFLDHQQFSNLSVAEKDQVLFGLAFRQMNSVDTAQKLREALPGMIADRRVVEAE